MQNLENLCGLFLVDKSPNVTSHKVVSVLRKTLKIDKIGHLGTLDPFATGLLPVLIGGATKLSDEIMDGKKQYLFTVTFGSETDTLDNSGRVLKTKNVPADFVTKAEEIISSFLGVIEQVPPVYSALKMNGKPLYEYMRSLGKLPEDIETKKRNVFIEQLEILSSDLETQSMTFRVLCGKGTYVRSLARDIALAIDTVGHCSQLRREFVEPWSVNDALLFTDEKILNPNYIKSKIISVEEMLPHIPVIVVDSEFQKFFNSGNVMYVSKNQILSSFDFYEISLERRKIFLKIKDAEGLFLAEIEFQTEKMQFKIMPKKKLI